MKNLHIARGVSLPIETATDTIGLLAIKGAGKTHSALVLAEEIVKANVPVVVFDVVGVCWGLRLGADGKSKGLPFYIFGGRHGDLPLTPTSGKTIADTVVEHRPNVVLDLSSFETKADQNRFILDFCTRIYAMNRDPIHLIMDEADDYCPQKPFREEARTLRAVEVLVRRGRAKGIGVTLITQRSASINKGVLTQVSTLIVGRTISPQDRKAVAAWVDAHGTEEQKDAFFTSIASLPTKEKWIWAPARDVFVRAQIRDRETFDSSFTPKIGDRRVEVKELSPLDLDALRGKLAAAIEQAKSEDPKALRARIAELEMELKAKPAVAPVAPKAVKPKVLEIPAVDAPMMTRLEKAVAKIDSIVGDFGDSANAVRDALEKAANLQDIGARVRESIDGLDRPKGRGVEALIPRPPNVTLNRSVEFSATKPHRERVAVDGEELTGPELKILKILAARHAEGTEPKQLHVLSGYPTTSSTVRTTIGALRRMGLVEPGKPFRATEDGLAAAGAVEELPGGEALFEHWISKLDGPHRNVLRAIWNAHPRELTRAELHEITGYPESSSTVRTALGRLRTIDLVTKSGHRLGPTLEAAR